MPHARRRLSVIAFSIRKDWKVLPQWLLPSVNVDAAVQTGTKETGLRYHLAALVCG